MAEILSRHTDLTPVKCGDCGWIGRAMDCKHGYAPLVLAQDVEPVDYCPKCDSNNLIPIDMKTNIVIEDGDILDLSLDSLEGHIMENTKAHIKFNVDKIRILTPALYKKRWWQFWKIGSFYDTS